MDVIIMVVLGIMSLLVVTMTSATCATDDECNAAIAASFFTILVMVIGYCVMSKVLDMMVVTIL
jgi:hypothetical protein